MHQQRFGLFKSFCHMLYMPLSMRLYYLSSSSWRFHFSYFFIFLHQNLPLLFASIQVQQQAEVKLSFRPESEHGSIKEKCYKHFYILQLYDSVLFTDVSLHYYSIIKTVKTVAPKSLTH